MRANLRACVCVCRQMKIHQSKLAQIAQVGLQTKSTALVTAQVASTAIPPTGVMTASTAKFVQQQMKKRKDEKKRTQVFQTQEKNIEITKDN